MGVTDERFLAFIVTLHVLLFFAADGGLITDQQGDNPHKQVIEDFDDPEITDEAQLGEDSGIFEDISSPIFAVTGFVNSIVGIITSPYVAVSAAPLPEFFQVLFGTLLGLFEIIVSYRVITGRL